MRFVFASFCFLVLLSPFFLLPRLYSPVIWGESTRIFNENLSETFCGGMREGGVRRNTVPRKVEGQRPPVSVFSHCSFLLWVLSPSRRPGGLSPPLGNFSFSFRPSSLFFLSLFFYFQLSLISSAPQDRTVTWDGELGKEEITQPECRFYKQYGHSFRSLRVIYLSLSPFPLREHYIETPDMGGSTRKDFGTAKLIPRRPM